MGKHTRDQEGPRGRKVEHVPARDLNVEESVAPRVPSVVYAGLHHKA